MDRILEVNERNHYALVEPGVSYFDLYRYIQEHKLKVWIDPPDPGWGGLVGNTLDRGGGRTPMHEHFAAQCGMEVVLANGEVMRTGMGALPNSTTWQQYKYGFGPYIDGIFSQSNFGVVTKMGVWLMPEPEAFLAGTVLVPKHDDLVPLVDTLAHLKNLQILQSMIALGSPLLFYRAVSRSVDARRARRPLHRGDGSSRRGKKSRILERRSALLRASQSDQCAMGVRQGKIVVHSRREIQETTLRTRFH